MKWTKEKINLLASLIENKSNEELAILFKTTQNSIANCMTRNNIRRKQSANRKEIKYTINSNGCWICNSHCKDSSGYICYSYKNGRKLHRYMYEKHNGKIPEGMLVRHTCDTPACINPNHLILGTHKDNKQDSIDRGRHIKGEKIWQSKVSEDDVKEIRELAKNKYYGYLKNIMKKYNISKQCALDIISKKSWKHIK